MKIEYFPETDSLYIELADRPGSDTREVEKGIIVGPEATILNESLTNRLNSYALFTPVLEIPTPEGAAAIIEVLNEIYNLIVF